MPQGISQPRKATAKRIALDVESRGAACRETVAPVRRSLSRGFAAEEQQFAGID